MTQWSFAEITLGWALLSRTAIYEIHGPEHKTETINPEHVQSFIAHLLSSGWEPLGVALTAYGSGTTATIEKGTKTWCFKKLIEVPSSAL